MMLRRVASARVSAAWRSVLHAKMVRPCVHRDGFAIRTSTQRVGDWNLVDLPTVKPRFFCSSAAAAPAATQAPATATTVGTDSSDEEKAALIAQLRPLCRALYSEHRAATCTDALLSQWRSQMTALVAEHADVDELQDTYKQGVAILLKQREFTFAQDLIHQMRDLAIPLHTAIYGYQISAVALQWLTQPLPLEKLRELPLDNHHWEPALLELVRTEDQPYHRKSDMERQQFHTHLVSGVRDVLAAYEAAVPLEEQEIRPYNKALRVYAANGVPFGTSLRVLNQIPPQSRARSTLTVDTFLALLEGARWDDVRRTVERLAKSAVLRRIDNYQERSAVVARVWDQALRAVCKSYSERMMDKRSLGTHQFVKQLRGILEEVETQLQALLPEQRFATIEQHNAVFEVRVKTAAQLGMSRQLQSLLDEYVARTPVEFASGQLDKHVFLKALEIFPLIGLKRVSAKDIECVRGHEDVLQSPEVAELQQTLEHVVASIEDKKQQMKTLDKDSQAAKDAGKEIRKEHQRAGKLKKKIEGSVSHRAVLVAHRHRIEAADRIVDHILARLATSDEAEDDEKHEQKKSPLHDLDVAVALMWQFMTTANRFAARMHPHTREIMSEEIMDRVFDLLDVALGEDKVEEKDRELVQQLLSHAAKTAAVFWREQDLKDVLRLKKKALDTDKLDAEDYDRLVFLRVQKLDIDGAYTLLQEMHFAGVAPMPTTIHRVVTGTLHRLTRPRDERPKFGVATTTMDEQNDAMEDEDTIEQGWSDGPRSVEDLPSFIQEWYNLYRVKPMAKTVVPVFAWLLAANKIWEVKRFLQILDSMDGGLSPATEYWLEWRLEAAGKTIEDLRYKR